ncbi:MAG: trypsin-like serine protease [Planctomycetes bacterium]|nr:trypsin-like serine protease [Planctomycetota bacterium]
MRSRPSLVLLALSVVAAVLPAQGDVQPTLLAPRADEPESPARRAGPAGLVAKVRPAVVWVAVEVDGARGKFTVERASTGVVADGSGLVLTLARLVKEAVGADDKRMLVQLDDAGNTQLPATIVRLDERSGLALLRVQPPTADLQAAAFGPDSPAAGEPLVVVARPDGKEMLAFGGTASPAQAGVLLGGVPFAAGDLFLTDSRNDERCDGAPVFDAAGRCVGLYDAEHVRRDVQDPTLDDLRKPSFGVARAARVLRGAFAAEFASAKNASLQRPASGAAHAQVAAVANAAKAVVGVWCGDGDWPALGGDDPGAVRRRDGLGSGVVLTPQGLVVANAHVVRGGSPRVRLADGRAFPAKVVKTAANPNLALLQAELPAGTTLPAAAANGDGDVVLGEGVLAIGNPLGGRPIVSAGVVSALRSNGDRIQADAKLGAQNGGGAVVDANGRLLGIGDAGASDPLETAFALRGDRVSTETDLSTFVAIARVRKAFAAELGALPAAASSDADRARRASRLTAMVEKVRGAMLNLYVAENVAKQKEDDLFPPEPVWLVRSLGSGVVISPDGLAISNWHVVDDATNPDGSMVADRRVTARVFGGKEHVVKVLSISREDDLSLLQLELAPGERLTPVELGSSAALAVGEEVAAIGNPLGQANTITAGIVTAKGQELRVKRRWAKLEHLIESDATINGGNSGGALLDRNGRLVGINSAGGGVFNNKGYAIDVDHVRKQLLGLLLSAYKLRSPDLGLRVVDEDGRTLVFDVDPRGPAAAAGVKSGDRITALGGTAIAWGPGFALTLLRLPAEQPAKLELERAGAKVAVDVAPMAPERWAVVRQSGLLVRDFAFADDPDRVRAAAIALHREFTGDRNGEPQSIPLQVVAVDKVILGEQPDGVDIAAGDFLLACEFVTDKGDAVRKDIGSVAALRDLWNDRELGDYDRQQARWKCWVARGAAVRIVELRANRLFW